MTAKFYTNENQVETTRPLTPTFLKFCNLVLPTVFAAPGLVDTKLSNFTTRIIEEVNLVTLLAIRDGLEYWLEERSASFLAKLDAEDLVGQDFTLVTGSNTWAIEDAAQIVQVGNFYAKVAKAIEAFEQFKGDKNPGVVEVVESNVKKAIKVNAGANGDLASLKVDEFVAELEGIFGKGNISVLGEEADYPAGIDPSWFDGQDEAGGDRD